jgi:aminomethyltransferase
MFANIYKNDKVKRAEHEAVRTTVGWYYFTHHLVEVTGPDTAVFLDRIFANPVANVKPGGARYTTMLKENGQILDDAVVFRLEEDKYWISTLFIKKVLAGLDAYKEGYDVEYADITATVDMYAVQGPKSKDLLNAIVEASVDDQRFFTIRENRVDGIPVKISRAGFTGEEFGYEIYVAPENARLIEKKLETQGKAFGAVHVEEFQVMVWTLPVEKGFYHMSDIDGTNPLEVGLDRGIGWDRDFVGREALERIKAEGVKRQIVGFVVDDEDAHIAARNLGGPGAAVMLDGEEVGRVAKYTYGYSCEQNIGYALIDTTKVKIGDRVTLNDNWATLTDRVFVKEDL